MKRSRSGHSGSFGSCFITSAKRTYAAGAIPMGSPGWPLLACCTASIDSVLIVSMDSWGSAFVVVAMYGECHGMTDAMRTPDELFEGLPDFPFAPHYRTVDGFRVAHV